MISPLIKKFEYIAEKFAPQTAIIHKKKKISYADLNINVKKVSAWLGNKEVTKGDRILVFIQ